MVEANVPKRIPGLALGILLGLPLGLLLLRIMTGLGLTLPPCPLKELTGLPCATCGLTRMAQALGRGDIAEALHWHPVALVVVGLSPLVALWDLHRAWRGRPLPPLPESWWSRAAVILLFLGTWALQITRGI